MMFKSTVTALGGLTGLTLLAAPAFAQHSGHGDTPERPWSQADEYWGTEAMGEARTELLHHHGSKSFAMVMLDRAEIQFPDDEPVGVIDGNFWYGGDTNKLYVKFEGEYDFHEDSVHEADVELLWSRAVSTYFDLQTGLRYDIKPDGKAHAVLGVQGLAPYWFELDGAGYLSEEGDVTFAFETEYEFLLTQRLILQPRLELSASAQDIADEQVGAGLTNMSAGVRLRYEFTREFAPYIGVEMHKSLGETASIQRGLGEDTEETVLLVGFRAWY